MTKKKKLFFYVLCIGILLTGILYAAERMQVSAAEQNGSSQPSISVKDNGKGNAYLLTLEDMTSTGSIKKIQFVAYCNDFSNIKTYDARLDQAGNYVAVLYVKDFAEVGNYQVTAYAQLNNGLSRRLAATSFVVEQYQEPDAEIGDKVSILGDSLSTFEGSTAYDSGCNYYNSSIMDVNDTWWMQFINQNGLKLDVNDSIGGSRVTWDGTTEDDEYHLGKNYALSSEERIQKLEANGTPDVILVFGGTNDLLSNGTVNMGRYSDNLIPGKVDDFADAYYTMLFRLKYHYPDAKIICLIPYDIIYTQNGVTDSCAEIISNICTEFGATCVDLRDASIDAEQDLRTEDYIHLNAQGMDKVTSKVQSTLEGGGVISGNGKWKLDWRGRLHYYYPDGTMAVNTFMCDGTYTYYLQADGTPMKNRLTYHPDGVHLIYFDEWGHELFDTFKFCEDVQYTCYFNTFGYAIFDEIAFYQDHAYYMDATGRMQNNGWFRFANGTDIGYANPDGTLKNDGFDTDAYGRTVFFHWNGMVARGLITDGTWYYNMDMTDGHLLGKFAVN